MALGTFCARRLLISTRGAMAVEFMPAFTTLLLAFLCFAQMAKMYTAGIVMRHATVVAGRYASVSQSGKFIPDPEDRMGARAGGRSPPLNEVATEGLGPWKHVIQVTDVRSDFHGSDPWGDVRTTVHYTYKCTVPIAKFIACRNGTLTRTIEVVSPLHGARYILDKT